MNPWGDLSHIIFWSAYAFVLILMVIHVLAYALPAPGVWLGVLGFGLMWALPLNASASLITWCVWALWLIAILSLIPTPIRSAIIGGPVFRLFRKVLPSVSQTEQEALDAGTVWWEGELFSGRPNWSTLLAYPKPSLSVDEQAFLAGPVNELCEMLNDWKISFEMHDLPPMVWAYIKSQGFLGIIIPRQYGGLGFSAIAHSEIVMRLSTRCGAAAVTVMVPNSLGPAELLLHYGTTAQKNYYLPRLAKGEEIPCFALTSPDAGSDAGGIPDFGVVCRGPWQGQQDVLGIRLTWEKRYITLGPVATLLGLAFRLHDPEQLLGDQRDLGITLALIPTHLPGVHIGRRHRAMTATFMNGPNWGRDVFIPMDQVIGGVAQVGQGWKMLMNCLAAGRSISLPASSVGVAKLATLTTGAYARVRRQFKLSIGRFEGVEEVMARMAANTYVMDAARVLTAGAIDLGEKPAVASAIVKYHLTERGRDVIRDAMDIHGGKGICMGPSNYLASAYMQAPIGITVEGANILTRNMMIFGQGAIRCHPFVLPEIAAARESDPVKARRDFEAALMGHAGFLAGNILRSLCLGMTTVFLPHKKVGAPELEHYYRQLTRFSSAFALSADAVMLLCGGSLKRKERLSARLGDILSDLYLASAVLKRFEDEGRQIADLPLVKWILMDLLYHIEDRLSSILSNLPSPFVAMLLRVIVFPSGRQYTLPAPDHLGHRAAQLMMQPGATRDRLSQGVFVSQDSQDPVRGLEDALQAVIAAEPIEERVRQSRNSSAPNAQPDQSAANPQITAAEATLIAKADTLRRRAIMVDDFPKDFSVTEIYQTTEPVGQYRA